MHSRASASGTGPSWWASDTWYRWTSCSRCGSSSSSSRSRRFSAERVASTPPGTRSTSPRAWAPTSPWRCSWCSWRAAIWPTCSAGRGPARAGPMTARKRCPTVSPCPEPLLGSRWSPGLPSARAWRRGWPCCSSASSSPSSSPTAGSGASRALRPSGCCRTPSCGCSPSRC